MVLKELPKLKEKVHHNKTNKKSKKSSYFAKNFVEFRDYVIKGINNLLKEEFIVEEKLLIELYYFIIGICDMIV